MNLEKIRAYVALKAEMQYLLDIIDQLSDIPEVISDAQEPGEWNPDTSDEIVEYVRSYIANVFLDAS